MRAVALTVAVMIGTAGCDLSFTDDKQSLLLKPEILSMVLEPPQAAPGDAALSSFLLADQHGVLQPLAQLWLPADLTLADPVGSGPSPGWLSALRADLPRFELTWSDLSAPRLAFQAPATKASATSATAESTSVPLSLLVQVKPLCAGGGGDLPLLDHLAENLACGAVKLGLRTLPVSTSATEGSNPRLRGLTADDGGGARSPLATVHSDEADLAASRQRAIAGAFPATEQSTLTLDAEAEPRPDGSTPALEYQWISNGGSFDDTRKRTQRWVVPAFREPRKGEPGGSDPRSDPNLYALWVILRETGATARPGQSWVELYVRVRAKAGAR